MSNVKTAPSAEADFDEDDVLVRPRKAPAAERVVKPADMLKAAAAALEEVRAKHPVLGCLAGGAVAPTAVEALLALGAAPVAVSDSGEATALAAACGALWLHAGTVDRALAEAMRAAVARANASARPWVLAPAGAGPLPLRTYVARELMRRFPGAICGTPDEILVLAGVPGAPAGAPADAAAVLGEARRLAQITHAALIVAGAEATYVCAENAPVAVVPNPAAAVMARSGEACVIAALAAAFLGVMGGRDRFAAAVAAVVVGNLAAAKAAAAKGPGTFKAAFSDALAALTSADVIKGGKFDVLK